jgi:hypothetical protein
MNRPTTPGWQGLLLIRWCEWTGGHITDKQFLNEVQDIVIENLLSPVSEKPESNAAPQGVPSLSAPSREAGESAPSPAALHTDKVSEGDDLPVGVGRAPMPTTDDLEAALRSEYGGTATSDALIGLWMKDRREFETAQSASEPTLLLREAYEAIAYDTTNHGDDCHHCQAAQATMRKLEAYLSKVSRNT